ncbi:unnamed protein product [Diamesa tonsa]
MVAMDNGRCLTLAAAPLKVLETIFNYLDGKDLINTLAVCRSFNNVISSSNKQMDKIRLNVDHSMDDMTELKLLMKSTNRNYQHLSVSQDYVYFLKGLDYFNWKSIRVEGMTFDKYLLDFLKQFVVSLEEIEFDQVYIDPYGLYTKAAYFNNLDTFTINGSDDDAVFILSTFVESISQFKNLKMPQAAFGRSYMEFFDSRPMIETLYLTSADTASITDTENTLYLISDSLRELTMECYENSTLQFIWREMIVLEKLNIKIQLYEDNNPGNFNLQENQNIKELYILNKMLPDHVFKEIYIATPNLETWRFAELNLRIKTYSLDAQLFGYETSKMYNYTYF